MWLGSAPPTGSLPADTASVQFGASDHAFHSQHYATPTQGPHLQHRRSMMEILTQILIIALLGQVFSLSLVQENNPGHVSLCHLQYSERKRIKAHIASGTPAEHVTHRKAFESSHSLAGWGEILQWFTNPIASRPDSEQVQPQTRVDIITATQLEGLVKLKKTCSWTCWHRLELSRMKEWLQKHLNMIDNW